MLSLIKDSTVHQHRPAMRRDTQVAMAFGGPQPLRYGRESGSVSKVDMQAALAWTRGRLSFESSPLVFVASELNRYSNQRVVLESTPESTAAFLPAGGGGSPIEVAGSACRKA
jgi:ferric-dicitrate binding protein FerR (iron transport regulator)